MRKPGWERCAITLPCTCTCHIKNRPFQEALSGGACYRMHMHPHICKSIWTLVKLHKQNKLCLIKKSTKSHVTVKQTAVFDQTEVTFISTLILKAIDCTKKPKKFSSQSSLQEFRRYICTYKK